VLRDMWRHKASAAQWSVLAALYLHAGPDGSCFPSLTRLEDLTGLDRRTVSRAIVALLGAGIISREKSPGRANVYRLTTRGGSAPTCGEVGASQTPTRGNSVPEVGAPVPPKQEELEQAINTPGPRAAEERGPGESIQGSPQSFFLDGFGEVFEHDTWALEQPDARDLYVKTFGAPSRQATPGPTTEEQSP
jgi:DNA-binding transcriptional ArsR family regulator